MAIDARLYGEVVCYSHRSTSRPDHTQYVLHDAGRLEFSEQPLEAVANDASMKPTSTLYANLATKISTLLNPMKVFSSIYCIQTVYGLRVQPRLGDKRASTKKDGVKDHRRQIVWGLTALSSMFLVICSQIGC